MNEMERKRAQMQEELDRLRGPYIQPKREVKPDPSLYFEVDEDGVIDLTRDWLEEALQYSVYFMITPAKERDIS